MALRRFAIGLTVLLVVIVMPGCRFSRNGTTTATDKSATTASTVEVLGDLTTVPPDTSTTDVGATTSVVHTAATTHAATATTAHSASRPATTARPAPAPTTPHCSVSVPDSTYGSTWTGTVSSTFPNASVTLSLSWPGGSGNYSGITDGSGTWVKTQRVQPSMRNQRVNVTASVGGRTCSTSFTVS